MKKKHNMQLTSYLPLTTFYTSAVTALHIIQDFNVDKREITHVVLEYGEKTNLLLEAS